MEAFGISIEVDKLWILAGVIIACTEFLFPAMVSIWSGLAAVITGIMIWTRILKPESFTWQFFWFFVLTIVLLLLWFFFFKKRFSSYANDSRDSSLNNVRGTVTSRIAVGVPGQIELFENYHGIKKWKAVSGETLEEGTLVTAYETDGIKLKVKKMEE